MHVDRLIRRVGTNLLLIVRVKSLVDSCPHLCIQIMIISRFDTSLAAGLYVWDCVGLYFLVVRLLGFGQTVQSLALRYQDQYALCSSQLCCPMWACCHHLDQISLRSRYNDNVVMS